MATSSKGGRMGLFTSLNPLVFALALAAGLLLTYVTVPPPKIIVRFPSPQNAGSIVYRGEGDTCYKYLSEKTSCALGEEDKKAGVKVKDQPVDGADVPR